MDFELSEEHVMIRNTVRDFAEKEIAPEARDNNRNEYFPVELVKKMGEAGLMGLTLPMEYGGGRCRLHLLLRYARGAVAR